MDTLAAILKLAGAIASLAAGVIKVLSAASDRKRNENEKTR